MSGRRLKAFTLGVACACSLLGAPGVRADVITPAIKSENPGLHAKATVERERIGNVLVVDTDSGYDLKLPDGSTNSEARLAVANATIASLGDNFDFIVVAPAFQINLGEFQGLHWQVSNDVVGIGRPILDLTSQFGSNGRLKAVIDLDESILQSSVTDADYDHLMDTLMHEIMHQWVAYADLQAIVGDASSALTTPTSHWSSKYDSQASVMFGARWQQQSDGRYREVKIRDGYGPLDLYLAGFLPLTELPDTSFLTTNALTGIELPELGRTVSGVMSPVSSSQVIDALGVRIPAAASSQRQFTAALVMLARAGDSISPASVDRLELMRVQAQTRFAAITLGRAGIRIGVLPQSFPGTRGSPNNVSSSLGALPAIDLALATSWLVSRQASTGVWRDKAATTLQDSRRVIDALAADPAAHSQVLAGALQSIATTEGRTTDRISALLQIQGMPEPRRTELLQSLLTSVNADGGWGLADEFSSSTLDTALALRALARADAAHPGTVPVGVISAATDLLSARYRVANQCWSAANADPCDLLTSVAAVQALASVLETGDSAVYAQGLFRWQQASDGFGSGTQATSLETALALNVLQQAGVGDDPRIVAGEAFLAAQQRTDGSWAGSISATAEALLWFQSRERADLRFASAVNVSPQNPVQGQPLNFSFDVQNSGSQPAIATELRIEYRETSQSDWVALPEPGSLPAMLPDQVERISGQWPTVELTAGTYELRVRLDAGDAIPERDELNNTRVAQLALLPAPELPDLTVALNSLQLIPAVITSVPQQVEIRAEIANLGLQPANQVAVAFFGWRFGELRPLGSALCDVPGQSSISLTQLVEIDDLDISRVVVLLDPDNLLIEANESNNQAFALIDRQPTVDLAIDAMDLIVPATPEQGAPTHFLVSVRNLGTRPSPITKLRTEVVHADGTVILLADQQIQLEAAALVQRRVDWTPDREGSATLRASVDFEDLVVETREDNNIAEQSFVIAASTSPNLTLAADSWGISPNPALQGAQISLEIMAVNSSTIAAPAIDVEFLWSDAYGGDFQSIGSVRLAGGLAAGASQQISLQSPTVLAQGSRRLLARIDPQNEVIESNEADNETLYNLPVLSLPNLQLAAVDTQLVPSNPAPGGAATVTTLVRNTGEQAIPQVDIELLWSDGSAAAALQTVSNLAPGTSTSLQFEFTRSVSGGAASLQLIGDRAAVLNEGREDDNSTVIELDSVDPDFVLTETFISPNGDGVQDRTEIVARLSPAQAARIRIVAPWGEEVAVIGDASSPVTTLSGSWDGRRPDGRRALDDRYEVRLEDAAGVPLKLRTVVLDTNRSPLVHAARDGHALVTPLTCAADNGWGTATAEGLDFEIRATQIATQGIGSRGIYRFDFDGSSPQPLLLLSSFAEPTQFTSRNLWLESSGTVAGVVLEDVDGDHLHVISTDSGAAMAPSVLIGPAGVSYLGSLSSGHRIFRGANNELLAVHPDTGTVTNISGSDLIDFDSMTPVVGGAKVIARMQGSAGSSILFKLFGLSVSTTIATELTEFGPAFWSISRPPVEYSLARQAFILSSGPVSAVYDHSFRQQILEISENTGAVEVNADSPQGITNFTVTVSPSGSRILTVRGDNGEARLWDFSTGVAVTIDLAPVRPDPEATLQGFPIGYAVYDFHWSPDESYLAARYGAYQDPDSLEILAENGFLIEARTGELRALGDFRPQAWINGELQLVDGLRGMAIERAFEAWPMLPATSNLSVGQYRPEFTDGRTAVFDTANFQGDCTVHGSQALSSTANGYSNFELEFVPALRSFAITGSALDLNPHDYSLAYQREGESEWSELVSGAANLEDRFLGSWSPPGPGRYTVRLSISDAAGNRVESKRSVVWFESAPIGFVRASEEVISPNGDGVQDRIEVHYELRTPLALAIRVADESGALVRTVNLVHSGPGVYSWQWDGRNESGQVVADGRYRITVYDRSLKVIVDTALPVANVEVLSPGLQACSNLVVSSEWVRSFVPLGEEGGYIRLSGSDSNGPSLSLQQRPRGSTQPWQLMALTAAADGDGRIPKFDINLKPGEISDLEFRAYAIDRGGNSVSIPVQTPGLAITSARLVDGDWINRRSPGDAQCPCDVAVYGASVQPGSIRMGLMAVDPNDWHLEARISRSGGPLSGWNQLPWRMLTMPEDMAEGGDRTKLCFGEREWLVAADIPGFSNGDFARLRFVRSYSGGQLVSNEMKVSSIQGGAGPTPSGLPPGGCGLGYCSRVGGVDAFLPICMEDFDYTVNWPDPRSGNLVPLDVLTSNQPQLQVGLVGLPGGEHRVVARGERPLSSPPFTDIRVSDATVAIDVDGPPRVQIDQPLEGARLCIGGNSDQSRVVATVGEAFLDKVEFYAALSEAIHVDRRSLDVERLLRPDIGGRALASVNPHPFVTQVLPSVGSGPGVVRLTARDCSASTTVERNVFFDSEVSVGRGLVGRDLSALRDPVVLKGGVPFAAFGFAPSLQQELHFALFANESVQASAAVRHLGGRPIQLGLGWDQDWSATGGVIADLGMRSASSGLISWSWDGLDASGNQVVDGEYLVQITLHDDCGHELVRWVPFYLDNHAPDITWIQPEPGESVDLFQPVRAALLDANPLTADLHYRALVGSANWEVIREGFDYGLDPAVQPDPLALWHSDVPAGAYQLRLAARDQVGHVSESTIEVQVPERQPMLAAVDLAPNLISPNDDGVLDQASLQLGFNRGARTTLQLANASGQAVRTLLNDSLASGVLVLDWDGKNDASTVVPDGNYQWILRVVDPAQVLNVEEVALPIAVDNTAPSVVFRAPHGSFSNGRGPLLIDLVEMHPQLLSANSTPAMPGLLAQVDRAGNITLAELDAVPEGVYRIDLLADDLAGNRSSFSHSFTLDRTPPVAEIVTPVAGAVLTRMNSPISIVGSATDANLSSWRVRVVELASGTERLIGGADPATSGAVQLSWDGVGADGDYRIELVATDGAGNTHTQTVDVALDNTPPTARIDVPSQSAFVGLNWVLSGAASDAHLDRYEIDIAAPAGVPVWNRVAADTNPVVNGPLASLISPIPDGAYIVRLRAIDAVGLVSEAFRDVRVDTQAPDAPLSLLAQRQGARDVRLTWTAATAPDVDHYRVFRDGSLLLDTAGSGLVHVDAGLADGRYRYRVAAVDRAGNPSPLSPEATASIDTTPPEVRISRPYAGERTRGIVSVLGRAYSREDFERFELRMRRIDVPSAIQIIATSGSAVLAGELGRFDSRTMNEALVRLELEGWDTSGNHAQTEVEFVVDNLPPAAPTGLVAQIEGNHVRLQWDANTESDLKGYLLYRGPLLLQGDPALDPRLLAITDTIWLDLNIGDGTHEWRAIAVDTTGNISEFSEPATITLSGRPPRVNLVRPLDGERFDTSTLVRGQSADLDLAEVQFEARPLASSTWTTFGPAMNLPPWETDFTPAPRAFGDYRLRARSLDTEGLADPAPPEITVMHRDLTAPASPGALTAMVDGDTVNLSWQAVTAEDLAGYRLDRATGTGEFVTIADVGATVLAYVDANLADGGYRYRVRARDDSDNLSQSSPITLARVYKPKLNQPYTPSLQDYAELVIESPVAGTLQGTRTSAGGVQTLVESSISANTPVTRPQDLDSGDNAFAIKVRDALGNLSRAATVELLRASVPPTPDSLLGPVAGHEVSLSWQIAAHPDPLGFRVFRNGLPILPDQDISPSALTMTVDQTSTSVPLLIDDSAATSETFTLNGQTIEFVATLPGNPVLVASELEFVAAPEDLMLRMEADWRGRWVTLPASVETIGNRIVLTPSQSYRSTQIRLTLSGGAGMAEISEIRVRVRPLQTNTTLTESLPDGRHRYRVAAVNQHAFESLQSEPLDVDVGDVTPPDPVVLSGSVAGSDITLNWTASNAPDLAAYWVMRGSTQIATITQLNDREYLDLGLANGQYGYRVFAVDAVGNIAESNLLVLGIDVGGVNAPTGLSVTPVVGGGALALSWQRGLGGTTPTGYRIKRSLSDAGPYTVVHELAPTSHVDTGLSNGSRYHYRIQARDAVGNLSPDSEPASAIPFTDSPVATPVFVYPTRYGKSVTLPERATVVAGTGQPGSSILIGAGAAAPANVLAAVATSARELGSGAAQFEASPDARHVYLWEDWQQQVRSSQSTETLTELAEPCAVGQWLSAHRLLICERAGSENQLSILHLDNLTRESLLELPEVEFLRAAPAPGRLVAGGDLGSGSQVAWRNLDGSGSWQVIAGVDPGSVDAQTLRFDPTGRWLLWRDSNDGRLRSADLSTGLVNEIDLDVDPGVAAGFAHQTRTAVIPAGGPSGFAIYLIDLPSAVPQWTSLGFGEFVGADFDSGDDHLGVLDSSEGWRLYSWPEGELQQEWPINSPERMQRLGTDEWVIGSDAGYGPITVVQPAGVFRLEALPLEFGNNLVAAIASAPGQLDSTPALPMTVIVPADGLPDLAIREVDISTLPNIGVPGSSVRVAARIRNLGSESSSPVSAVLRLTTPDGTPMAAINTPVAALSSGAELAVAWTTPLLNAAGVYGITVQIDPARQLQESSVANNSASRLFTVNADGRPELVLVTNQSLLGPTETLNGHVDVVNSAASFSGRISIRVLDDADHLVAQLRTDPVNLAAPGTQARFTFQWSPAGVRAGQYRVLADLRDLANAPVRDASAQFEVRPVALVHVALTPAQQQLAIGAAIALQARVSYASGNYPIANGELRSRLLAPDGTVLANNVQALPAMTSGFQADYPLNFASAALPPGAYSVVAEIWSSELLAEAGATLSLMQGASAPAVVGHFLLGDTPLIAGQALSVEFEVRNSGGVPMVDLPVHASVRRQLTTGALAESDQTWTLAPGEVRQGTLLVPSASMVPGGLIMILNIPSGPLAGVLDYRAPLVVDGEPPSIALIRPLANAIVPRDFQVEARVLDIHSGVAMAEFRLGTGAYNAMAAGPNYAGEYRSNALALADGPTTVQVRARDAFGNVGVSDPWPVVVDSVPPQIVISGVANGQIYPSAVTPLISATDLHLDQVRITLNGAAFNSGSSVVDDGRYTLFVSAIDLAGNRATAVLAFEVDTQAPVLNFTFPAEGAVIAASSTPVQLATEPSASVVLSLGAQTWNAVADTAGVVLFGEVPLSEGPNLLRANAVDAVGNAAVEQTRTVVRSTATVGLVEGSVQSVSAALEPGDAINGSSQLTNIGSSLLSAVPSRLSLVSASSGQTLQQDQWLTDLAPGQSDTRNFVLPSNGMTLGDYFLLLEAELRAANGAMVWTALDQAPVAIADLTPPELALLTPVDNELLAATFSVEASASDRVDQVESVDLSVDAGAFVPMTPVAGSSYTLSLVNLSDGMHTLQARATDRAGNSSVSPPVARNIEVDGTPPVIVIVGVEDGQLSSVPLTPEISVTDAHTASTTILLDGAPFVSGTSVTSEGPHVLSVVATDAAGNSSNAGLAFNLDFTPPVTTILEPAGTTAVGEAHIALLAQTEPGIDVDLLDQAQAVSRVSDSLGQVMFPGVPLVPGENILRVRARDRAGNIGLPASVSVFRFAVAQAPVTAQLLFPTSIAHGEILAGQLLLTASVPANGLPDHIRLEVIAGDQSVVTSDEQTVSLQLNQTLELPIALATDTWPAGTLSIHVSWRRDAGATVPWSLLKTAPIQIRDEVAPEISLLSPGVGSTVPDPIPVNVTVVDALSAVSSVDAQLDDGDWYAMAPGQGPDLWQVLLPAPDLGIHMLSVRAEDAFGNLSVIGPVPLCRAEDSPWPGFANGFEPVPPAAGATLGFEKTGCTALPAAAKSWVEWWLGSGSKRSPATQGEAVHAPR